MARPLSPPFHDFSSGLAWLQNRGRAVPQKRISANCYAYLHTELSAAPRRAIVVRLYSTDIVKFYDDGEVVISTGGYDTHTTKRYINGFVPRARVSSLDYQLYQGENLWDGYPRSI